MSVTQLQGLLWPEQLPPFPQKEGHKAPRLCLCPLGF